ncbi:hypothetical protein C8F04DRAFT_1272367 [Mycena alexandri]|uniref:Uncharacterized protein n=1 Tax=Mycena alexandri TaxID=1745969 RepID=A0AAD6S9Q0_9AGAR|nr:hypothetical protein C8F04DRAFT_1272367 [Mycena alexandri]
MADQHSSTKIVLVMLSTGTQDGGVANAPVTVPHFEFKRIFEECIAKNLPNLLPMILRAAAFMDQVVAGDPTSAFLIMSGTRLQFLAGSDISGLALQKPKQYIGKVVNLAGDELDSEGSGGRVAPGIRDGDASQDDRWRGGLRG